MCLPYSGNTNLLSQRQSSTVGTRACPCPCSLTDTKASTDRDKPASLRSKIVSVNASWYYHNPYGSRSLFADWDQCEYPQDLCVHQLFEQQVEQAPDAIAVVFEKTSLTYAELNCQANRLARCLLEAEVGPDVLVGVCIEPSLELVVAL